jgi:hypothetical protein
VLIVVVVVVVGVVTTILQNALIVLHDLITVYVFH